MSAALSASLSRARSMAALAADAQALATLADVLDTNPLFEDSAAIELECQARDLRLKLLVRNGRYVDALASIGPVLHRLVTDRFGVWRGRLLAPLGLAYVQVGLTAHALRCASAAFRFAKEHGDTPTAARALECIGICYMVFGDCPQGEQLTLESLGMMLQAGDESDVQIRLSNTIYLACLLHDAYRAAGNHERAQAALLRCMRFAAQGSKLQSRASAWASCLWRSNLAGWLRRRGELQRAEADLAAVRAEAAEHGWHVIERYANYEIGLAARRGGRLDEALALLRRVPIGDEAAVDSFDISLRAHRAMRDIERVRGHGPAALIHDTACLDLLRRRAALRDDVAERLGDPGEVAISLLPAGERARIEGEIRRLEALADAPVARVFDPLVPVHASLD